MKNTDIASFRIMSSEGASDGMIHNPNPAAAKLAARSFEVKYPRQTRRTRQFTLLDLPEADLSWIDEYIDLLHHPSHGTEPTLPLHLGVIGAGTGIFGSDFQRKPASFPHIFWGFPRFGLAPCPAPSYGLPSFRSL